MENLTLAPKVVARLRQPSIQSSFSMDQLLSDGREKDAFEAGARLYGELEHWSEQGLAARAIQLLDLLGAPRKAAAMAIVEWKKNPTNHELRAAVLKTVLQRRGALAAWMFMQRWPEPGAVAESAGPLLLLQGQISEELSDLSGARRCWDKALEVGMSKESVAGVRATAHLRSNGEFEEHEANETYRWAVAAFLMQRNQWNAAESLLAECVEDTQAVIPLSMLVVVQLKRRRAAEALATLDKFAQQAVLMEPSAREWAACRKAQGLLMSGNPGRAADALEQGGNAEGRKLIGRLRGMKFLADASSEQAALESALEQAAEKWSRHVAPVNEARYLRWLERRQAWAGLTAWYQLQFLRGGGKDLVPQLLKTAGAANQVEAALAFLRELWERSGKVPAGLALAKALEISGKPGPARELLETLNEEAEHDSDAGMALVDFLARHGFAEEARHRMARIETNVSRREWFALAAIQSELCGDWPSAQFDWREVLVRSPMDPVALRGLSRALLLTDGTKGAAHYFEELCESHPEDVELHRLWLETASESDQPRALKVLEKLEPANPEWLCKRARLLPVEKGLALLKSPEVASMKNASLFVKKATLELRLDKAEDARESLEMAVEFGSDQLGILDSALAMTPWLADRKRLIERQSHAIELKKGGPQALLIWVEHACELVPLSECLASMRRWKSSRPNAWQGAVGMARLLEHLKRLPEATEEISRALQTMPQEHHLWLELAHLRARQQQPEEERLAMEKAALLGGNAGPLWLRIAELHQLAGRHQEVMEALSTACGLAPTDAKVRERAAQIYWLAGDKEMAHRQLIRALHLDPDQADAWDRFNAWSKSLGLLEAPASLAWDLAAKRPGQPIAWLTLARIMSQIGDNANAEMALEKAAALDPKHPGLHQLRVQWLAAQERFDEAVAACRPAIFGKDVPWQLAAREAWVEAARKDLPKAIRLMRPIVEAHSGDAWCRRELVSWLLASGHQQEAEQLIGKGKSVMLPDEDSSLEIRLNSQSTPYHRLAEFDLALQQHRHDDARVLLSNLEGELPGPLVTARAAQLAAAQDQFESLAKCVHQLLYAATDDAWPVLTGLKAMEKSIGRGKLMKLLEEASQDPKANKWVPAIWVDKLNETTWKGLPNRVSKAATSSEGAREAIISYLEKLAAVARQCTGREAAKHRQRFQEFVTEALDHHSDWLRQTTRGWLAGGMALNSVNLSGLAWKWFADWKQRGKLPGPATEQLLLAMQSNGHHDEAKLVIRESLADGPGSPRLHIWDALYKTLDGREEEAQRTLDRCSKPRQGEDVRTAARLARMLIKVSEPNTKAHFNAAAQETLADFWHHNKALGALPIFRKSCSHFAKRAKSPRPVFWGFWKVNHRWLGPTLLTAFGLTTVFIMLLVKFPTQMHLLFPWLGKL